MIHRIRVVASLVAAVFLAGAGALVAAPAFASDAGVSSAIVASAAYAPTHGVEEAPVPVAEDATDQKPHPPVLEQGVTNSGLTGTGVTAPVAERASTEVSSLILFAGLGILFASILVVVRAGNQSNVGREH
jgi:hypothetical protein